MKLTLILFKAFLLTLNVLAGNTVYVKTDGAPFTSISNHTSWATATSELQTAVDTLHAAGGGEVWVAAGTYYPTLTNDRSISFYPRNNVILYGGFAGTETFVSERQLSDIDTNGIIEPWEYTHQTILSGEHSDPYHIVNGEGTDSTAILDGLVIKGSYSPGLYMSSEGIGLYYFKTGRHKRKTLYIFPANKLKDSSYFMYPFEKIPVDSYISTKQMNKTLLKNDFYFLETNAQKTVVTVDSIVLPDKSYPDKSIGTGAYYTNLKNCILSNNFAHEGSGAAHSKLQNCFLRDNGLYMNGDGGVASNCILKSCTIRANHCGLSGSAGAICSKLTDSS